MNPHSPSRPTHRTPSRFASALLACLVVTSLVTWTIAQPILIQPNDPFQRPATGTGVSNLRVFNQSADGTELILAMDYTYDGLRGMIATLLPIIEKRDQKGVSAWFGSDPVTIGMGRGPVVTKVKFFNDEPGVPTGTVTDRVRVLILDQSGRTSIGGNVFLKTIRWGAQASGQTTPTQLAREDSDRRKRDKEESQARAEQERKQKAEAARQAEELKASQEQAKADERRIAAERREAEARAKSQAEAKKKAEADEKAKAAAREKEERQQKADAEAKAAKQARDEEKKRRDAEALAAAKDAEQRKQLEIAQAREREQAERLEREAQRKAEEKLAAEQRRQADLQAKADAEARKKAEAEEKAQAAAREKEEKARKAEAEAKAREEARIETARKEEETRRLAEEKRLAQAREDERKKEPAKPVAQAPVSTPSPAPTPAPTAPPSPAAEPAPAPVIATQLKTKITNVDIVNRSLDRSQMTIGIEFEYKDDLGPQALLGVDVLNTQDPRAGKFFESKPIEVGRSRRNFALLPVKFAPPTDIASQIPSYPTDKVMVYLQQAAESARMNLYPATMLLVWRPPGAQARAAGVESSNRLELDDFKQNDLHSGYVTVQYQLEKGPGKLRVRLYDSKNPASGRWFIAPDRPAQSGRGLQLLGVEVNEEAPIKNATFTADTVEVELLDSTGTVVANLKKSVAMTWAKP